MKKKKINKEKVSNISRLPQFDQLSSLQKRNPDIIARSINRGEFWKPCPGTTGGYLCCGYQILTPQIGCAMNCRYCVLQAYFEHRCQVVYENFSDLERNVQRKLEQTSGIVRVGTGEFADSLYMERTLGLSRKVAAILAVYPNTMLEFKTKCADIESLSEITNPSKVIVGFSINTPRIIDQFEERTATLSERLKAARLAEKMGFWISFHFDPIIWYPQWQTEYRDVVQKIFSTIKYPEKIAWWSMGGLRCMPRLAKMLRQNGKHLELFSGEMVEGADGKLRYFRPIRVEFYQVLQEEIMLHFKNITLYLCMESPEVWKESSMDWRIPQGLVDYLDKRAKRLLTSSTTGCLT